MFRRFFSVISIFLLLVSCTVAKAVSPASKDFRGVWISTIYHLDFPSAVSTDPDKLKENTDSILDHIQAMGLTDVVLQVRPCADAFYNSSIFPWSRYLTGNQGTAPKNHFDPLTYWITEAHKRGLSLHAWINPFRITISGKSEISGLSSNNPAVIHPEYVVNYKGNEYFDPGIPAARQLILDGVKELAENYDIDGIQLDDYFYPGTDFNDESSFKAYGSQYSNRDSWRIHNINTLIQELGKTIHQINPDLIFGVSPSGIWANQKDDSRGSATYGSESLYTSYADSYSWVKNNWVDYLCPQIYWEFGYPQADYETLVRWWANTAKGTNVKLYIGLAAYKAQKAETGSVWYGYDELLQQLKLNHSLDDVSGECFFRYGSLLAIDDLPDALSDFYGEDNFSPEQSDSLPETEIKTDNDSGQTSSSFWQVITELFQRLLKWLATF